MPAKGAGVAYNLGTETDTVLPFIIESFVSDNSDFWKLNYALLQVVPAGFAGVAYNVATETVVPYLTDTVLPSLVDNFVAEETRLVCRLPVF